jgi:hypothetical protein
MRSNNHVPNSESVVANPEVNQKRVWGRSVAISSKPAFSLA